MLSELWFVLMKLEVDWLKFSPWKATKLIMLYMELSHQLQLTELCWEQAQNKLNQLLVCMLLIIFHLELLEPENNSLILKEPQLLLVPKLPSYVWKELWTVSLVQKIFSEIQKLSGDSMNQPTETVHLILFSAIAEMISQWWECISN